MIPAMLLRFWKPIAGALVIGLVLFAAYRWAHERGQAERDAHYAPILLAIQREKDAAIARVQTIEAASARITQETKDSYAKAFELLQGRAADAERSYARILRERPRGHGCDVPEVSGSAGGVDAAAESGERDDRLAGRLAGVGHACEEDATRLAVLQQWIQRQASLAR